MDILTEESEECKKKIQNFVSYFSKGNKCCMKLNTGFAFWEKLGIINYIYVIIIWRLQL